MTGKVSFIVRVSVISVLLMLAGCTTENWYEGFKQSSESRCRSQPPGESQRCLEALNKKSYQEYEKERSGQKP